MEGLDMMCIVHIGIRSSDLSLLLFPDGEEVKSRLITSIEI